MHCSIPRDTPVSSPRRVNPLTNKRVEMLKNCETETRREQLKQAQPRSLDLIHLEKQQKQQQQELAAAINRRIDLLRYIPTSAPNSPRFIRCSPRKTHITNFINQNVPPEVPARKAVETSKPPQSPQLQLNGRRMFESATSRTIHERRFRSQSPVSRHKSGARLHRGPNFDSDSDSEFQNKACNYNQLNNDDYRAQPTRIVDAIAVDAANHNYLPEFARLSRYDETDLSNYNVSNLEAKSGISSANWPSRIMQACPQSEPLKRKVYSGSSTFELIKMSFDLEAGECFCNYMFLFLQEINYNQTFRNPKTGNADKNP